MAVRCGSTDKKSSKNRQPAPLSPDITVCTEKHWNVLVTTYVSFI